MPIKQTTSMATIELYLKKLIEENNRKVLRYLSYVGESCTTQARTAGSYSDDTGNLRNSIGYVVASNGNVVLSAGFEVDPQGAKATASRKAIDLSGDTMALVVVAGMNYASYVAAKGYDVLDSAEILAPRLIKQLGLK